VPFFWLPEAVRFFANARTGVISTTFPITTRYFALAGPFLVSLILTGGGLRLLRPRPTYRRLLRSSSFIIFASVLLGLAITLLTILLSEMFRPPGQIRMTRDDGAERGKDAICGVG
jgi:hypothetical protein